MASTHILCTGKIVDGTIELDIAMPPVEDAPADGLLQQFIEEAEMTAELEDWLLDEEWLRSGC
jgi:hypothetical protein